MGKAKKRGKKMSSVSIGREFEEKAYKHLIRIFPKVIWLSKNKRTSLDFKCIDVYGKAIYGDAKHIKTECNKPKLSYSQRNADFVIRNRDGGVEIIFKKEFSSKVLIEKYPPKKCKSYLIRVDDKIWDDFINTIPRKKDINTAIVELLEKEVKKK